MSTPTSRASSDWYVPFVCPFIRSHDVLMISPWSQALVLDAEIASTFDNPDRVKIGRCDLIEEVVIGEDKVIRFSGCARGEACTVILRGSSKRETSFRPVCVGLELNGRIDRRVCCRGA